MSAEEGSWELGVGGWGRRELGEEGSWELGVRGWGRRELGEEGSWELRLTDFQTLYATHHTVTHQVNATALSTLLRTKNRATALFPPPPHLPIPPSSSPLGTPLLGVQATELGTLHSLPPSPHPPISPSPHPPISPSPHPPIPPSPHPHSAHRYAEASYSTLHSALKIKYMTIPPSTLKT
uniref:Uncharacterized protein n=1 Tax=Desertifilum tharense IPPAS B-1220 TaxID=1781255 RepID=A0ACD5H0A1_9CYAN